MIPLLTVLFNFPNPLEWMKNAFFGGILSDINLIIFGFKIVILLFIVSFVRSRFGGGPIVTILILVFGYIILFQNFLIFGPMMFIYLFMIFGFTTIVFDLAIAKPWKKYPKMEGEHMNSRGEMEMIEKQKRRMREMI